MNTRDPKLTALLFNECINARDIEGLGTLMADNISLISFGGPGTVDKEESIKAWSSFFKAEPEFRNHFSRMESRDNFVIIIGKNTYKNVLWSAIIENDKVSEWQVYDDTAENRERLKIQ